MTCLATKPDFTPRLHAPTGPFGAIVVDPPWDYANRATRAAARNHYATLTMHQLCGKMPLPDGSNMARLVDAWANEQSHLYLWVTNSFLREGFQLLDAWRFQYKTCLTWVKPQMGIGNYFRSSTEHVLFAIRGGLRTLDGNQLTWFQADRTRHSAKPDAFYRLVETSSPGPYLDVFGRPRQTAIAGAQWEVWGDGK